MTKIKDFFRDEQGSLVIWVVGGMVMMLSFAAMAVDLGHFYVQKNRLQVAADSAAYAAVTQLPDAAATRTMAHDYVDEHMPPAEYGTVLTDSDVEIGAWDKTAKVFTPGATAEDIPGGNSVNAVRVTTRLSQANGNPAPTFFAKVMGKQDVDIEATAIAGPPISPVCVLGLNPDTNKAIWQKGGSTFTANGCSMYFNSANAGAIKKHNSSHMAADDIFLVGDVSQAGGGGHFSPDPTTGVDPLPDPLASLAAPAYGGCDENNYQITSGTDTLTPGVYCGGIEVSGNAAITLDPGIYVISGGPFLVTDTATVTGTEVGIYLADAASVLWFDGSSQLNLSAPVGGEMDGVLFYHDRNVPYGTMSQLVGDAGNSFDGTLYFPTGTMIIDTDGAVTNTPSCSMYIAWIYELKGEGSLTMNHDSSACGNAPTVTAGRGNHLLQ